MAGNKHGGPVAVYRRFPGASMESGVHWGVTGFRRYSLCGKRVARGLPGTVENVTCSVCRLIVTTRRAQMAARRA